MRELAELQSPMRVQSVLDACKLLRTYKVMSAIRQRTQRAMGQEKPVRRGEEGVAEGPVGVANGRSPYSTI